MEYKELIDKLERYVEKQEIWYDKDIQLELELTCCDLRILVARLWFRVDEWTSWRKQQCLIYIDKFKNNTDMKSDTKCRAKFERDESEKIALFKKIRREYKMLLMILDAYQKKADSFKSHNIMLMHENKLLNNK